MASPKGRKRSTHPGGFDPRLPGIGTLGAKSQAKGQVKQGRKVREVLALRERTVVRIPVGVHEEYDGSKGILGTYPWKVQEAVAKLIAAGDDKIVERML